MTETMLALVALMITLFFTMNQQRGIVQAEQEIASVELEVMASAVGSEMMQVIATKEFDAATEGQDLQTVTLDDLTPEPEFGDSLDCPAACNDIDDFNDMQLHVMPFEVGLDEEGNQMGFSFAIAAKVQYVDDQGNYSPDPTWTKEVTLYVDQVPQGGESKYLIQPIQLKRQFSPQ